MRKHIIFTVLFFIHFQLFSREWKPQVWPVLKHYDNEHLYRVALPLGGIGTGTVSLGGRGELRDWEIMNRPGKGYSTVTPGVNAPFFAIYVKPDRGEPLTKALLGPLYEQEYLHCEGRPVDHHGFPRFKDACFDAAYPFGQVHLTDPLLPVKVTIKGFNPLIPADEEKSGIPIAILTYEVENLTESILEVSVAGSIRNFIGKDGSKYISDWKGDYIPIGAKNNRNEYREQGRLRGIYFTSDSVEINDPAWGTIALSTEAEGTVTYRTSSVPDHWNNSILNFWDDFSADGELTEKEEQVDHDPMASLAVKKRIAPKTKETFTFFVTWTFPNHTAWYKPEIVGNYYTTQYRDAWEVAEKTVPYLEDLERETLKFVNAFLSSDYPKTVKEAALFNLATLRSQTVFRLPTGHMMGWEGCMDRNGSCPGSCTHVWNYEQATAFLFGNLAKTMRDVEFNYATRENGAMSFRADLPLSNAATGGTAADGQMGTIMKFYREWQLSGDDTFLKNNWEQVKKVLAYAWIENGWDGNQDGVMEGRQHNTMDVDYFGPNPQMGFWYLGALRAAAEMARYVKDITFAEQCERLFQRGSRWMDEQLFNGEYYEHKITDPDNYEHFLDMDDPAVKIPPFQLGRGCLVDQLVGQYMSHICGLGYLAKQENIKSTLKSIMRYNYVEDFSNHFNNMRSFAMGDESGLLMASWPKGRLEVPFPYFAEVMTGFEYTAATCMFYEGMIEEGLKVISSIRRRHDGAKRNPFSEPECGHHYARSMASWSALIALSQFHYSGVEKEMTITSRPGRYFWSNGYAWGVCVVAPNRMDVEVLKGELELKRVSLSDGRSKNVKNINISEGEQYTLIIP